MGNPAFFHKEYHDTTYLHPLALTLTVLLGLAMLVLPRRYAVWPMIVLACFIAPAQRIAIFTLDFNLLRVLVVVGWLRVLQRGEIRLFRWKSFDLLILVYITMRVGVLVARRGPDVLIRMLGETFDVVGMYFLFRCLIPGWEELRSVAVGFAVVAVPVAVAFIIEHFTGRNLFSVFGGVPEFTIVREGRLRCQGAFAHSILAGCFWASVLPLMVAIAWRRGLVRWIAVIGMACSLLIIYACASSTPVISALVAAMGWIAFFARRWIRVIRWSVLLMLVGLHVVMAAPVWHLISRLRIVGGSTSYYRFRLIDQAILHINEWWLIGSDRGTLHWAGGMFDITNYYIIQGLNGGLLFLALLLAIITLGFKYIGRTCRQVARDREKLLLAWGLGTALFVHAVSFMGVSYFGQIIMVWYLVLAAIGSVAPAAARRRVKQPATRSEQLTSPAGAPFAPAEAFISRHSIIPS